MRKMQNNYTEEARQAIQYAARAAIYHRQSYAGTEHLLAGLLKATGGTASQVLSEAGVTPEKLTRMIDRLIAPQGGTAVEERPGFSPRAQRVLEKAGRLAAELDSETVGTEHLLLAMLRDYDCVGTRLLHTMGVDIRKLYADTLVAMHAQGRYSDQDLMSGKAMRDRKSVV